MAHFGLRLGCWQRDCSATNGGPPELDHSNKGTGSSIRVDARWSSWCHGGAGSRHREYLQLAVRVNMVFGRTLEKRKR